jgi:hypothetical protein
VYDMYPWDGAGSGGRSAQPPGPPRDDGEPCSRTPRATQAVQAALDRRDNGGDAAIAVEAVTETMAGPARQ